MASYGITLLSGGLDSTTVAAYARGRVDHLTALTFHYGQTHSKEVDCAREVAGILGIPLTLLDISFLGEVAWYSALTSPERFPIPRERSQREIGFGIPITYVPLRNTIFLSLAAARLESDVLHAIEEGGRDHRDIEAYVYMAPNAIDYSGYPDCRPEFYSQIKGTLELGSKLWTQYGISFNIETPIISLSKGEIAKMGLRLNAPIDRTWSCYEGGAAPCGECDSCVLRAKGFEEAGIPDPLMVRLRQG